MTEVARRRQRFGYPSTARAAERKQRKEELANGRAMHLELDTDIKSYVDTPIPGYSSVSLEQVKELFKSAMLSLQPPGGGKAVV